MSRNLILTFTATFAAAAWAGDNTPRFVSAWGKKADPDGQFTPLALAANAKGEVFVVHRYRVKKDKKSENRYRIRKFDARGKFALEWGDFSDRTREFRLPTGLYIDDKGFVYTSDGNTEQVQKYSPKGKLVVKFGAKGAKDGQSR